MSPCKQNNEAPANAMDCQSGPNTWFRVSVVSLADVVLTDNLHCRVRLTTRLAGRRSHEHRYDDGRC